MDGLYVIFILVEHHLSFFFYFYILEELYLMVHTFIIQILGFQEFFFSSSSQSSSNSLSVDGSILNPISYGSYFYSSSTWFSGILLFFFLMATAFMGYVLPFGQMSFWGATVITNLLSPFPCLIEWVCGGHYVYNPTLKRFFVSLYVCLCVCFWLPVCLSVCWSVRLLHVRLSVSILVWLSL